MILEDLLQGTTSGTLSGGSFVAGGWKVTGHNDTIWWHIPTVPFGAAEWDIRGLNPNEGRTGMEDKSEIFHMYDYTFGNSDTNYNRSRFDGNDPAITAGDDAAIALDKQPLLPGSTATQANYTSYSRGLNGILLDVAGLHDTSAIGADDFAFRVGNSNDPATWAAAPPPANIVVREGAGEGGADRISLVWNDGALTKTWLQITLLANDATGLADDDVFYFGNAIGEAGNSLTDALVNAADELLARGNPRNIANLAPIDFRFDYNRDQLVNAADQLISRGNGTNLATALRLISAPAMPGPAASAVPEPGTMLLAALGLAVMLLAPWAKASAIPHTRLS